MSFAQKGDPSDTTGDYSSEIHGSYGDLPGRANCRCDFRADYHFAVYCYI